MPISDAVTLCRDCYGDLVAADAVVTRQRERRRQQAATGERWITPAEAAAILACTDRNVRYLAQRGTLPTRRRGARLWVRESAVRALIWESDPPPAA